MSKSTKLKEQALEIIEVLIMINFPDVHFNSAAPKEKPILDKIYRIAHAATDTTCKHKEWEKEIEETYLHMKKSGLL